MANFCAYRKEMPTGYEFSIFYIYIYILSNGLTGQWKAVSENPWKSSQKMLKNSTTSQIDQLSSTKWTNNLNHVLSTWQIEKNACTTVQKSEALNLFQNNHVNSFSLLFGSLPFKFSVQPFELSVHDTCIPSSSFCLFAYFQLFASNSQ